MGLNSYKIDDIIEDILFDDKPYLMNEKLITDTFKNIRSIAGNTFLPIHKYVNGLDFDIDKIDKRWKIVNKIQDISLTQNEQAYTHDGKRYSKIEDILNDYPNHKLKELSYIKLNLKYLDVEDLGDYLRQQFKDGEILEKRYFSTFKQLVAAYDFFKYNKKKA